MIRRRTLRSKKDREDLKKLTEFYHSMSDQNKKIMVKFLSESQNNIEKTLDFLNRKERMKTHYKETADIQRRNGAKILISEGNITIITPEEVEYFLTGKEAMKLLSDVPRGISPENYILTVSKTWE
jgi:hypothetical protein